MIAAPPRRGSVIFIVMWTIAIATLIVAAGQLLSFRQATLGRVTVERVQARWAARSGIEYTMAVMSSHTANPVPDDAYAMTRDMEAVSRGELHHATWDIRHAYEGEEWAGPTDEHSKLNVNTTNSGHLLLLEDMTFDVADAIIDWIDDDDEPGSLGVEEDYYLSLSTPYEPRNAPIRNIAELELVAGIWPEYLRGEDWNLNGRLDPNENDGALTPPTDEPDGFLDAGWSEMLTTYSVAGGATPSGLPRIYLRAAEPEELVERCGVTDAQARSLIYYGRNEDNRLENLATVNLDRIDAAGNQGSRVVNAAAAGLDTEQLRAVVDECSITDPAIRLPGKMNINTVSPRLFRELLTTLLADDFLADEILFLRDSRPEGIGSMLELRDTPDLSPTLWNTLNTMFATSSNVFTVTSRGRSDATGVEFEIIAVVDRSTLPIRIIEYREQ